MIKVFISGRDSTCDECGHKLGRKAWITLEGDGKALCLPCADLDHLEFLPAGNAALTHRAGRHSALTAVVLKWTSARKRYERQGLLVGSDALERAEQECLADAEARRRRKTREAARRAELDQEYVKKFAEQVRDLYSRCPRGRETVVAQHACLKYSGRIGRSAAAKGLDQSAVRLAVIAHVRHVETPYNQLLAQGLERHEARAAVQGRVHEILADWEPSSGPVGKSTRLGERIGE